MELVNNTRVFFDPISHNYLLDDEVILTGVTTLMKKHGLAPDYSAVPEAVLRRAAEEGTAIHRELEAYDNGELMLVTDLIDQYRKLGLKCIASEYLVSDNETVASSIDKVYDAGEPGLVDLGDVKSTAKVHTRSLQWQLSIYKVLFERQNPGVKVRNLYCLHVDKKKRTILGLIPIEPIAEEEVDAIIAAERNGSVYVDGGAEMGALSVLSEEELQNYTVGLEKIAEAKDAIKQTEAIIRAYEARVLAYMEENKLDTLTTPSGSFKVKAAYERTTIDSAKLRKDYPNLAEKYGKTAVVKASLTYTANQI